MAVTSEPVLSLRDVTVRYAAVTAVDSVTFDIRPGTVTGLIGPNGAGKTSLVDAITGYARCEGDVIFAGKSITAVRPHRRARRGLVRTFQGAELFEGLTVEQNLLVGMFNGAVRGVLGEMLRLSPPKVPDVVHELLDTLGLAEVRHALATDLTVGQQKLVTVARAMVARPTLLALDEPAAGLDSSESREFGEALRRLSGYSASILLIEHDIDLVLNICDDIHVLEFGKLIASGSPAEIRRDPAVIAAYLGTEHS